MKRLLILIMHVVFINTVYGGSFRNTLSIGVAIPIGEGRENKNPGFNACIEPIAEFSRYFGLGGHADYTWITAKNEDDIDDYHVGNHVWDLALYPKFFAPLADDIRMYFDFDPALFIEYAYSNIGKHSVSTYNPYFGFTIGTGVTIGTLNLGFKFKTFFDKGETTKWIIFNVGFDVM